MKPAKYPLFLFALSLLSVFANALGTEYHFSANSILYATPNFTLLLAVFGLYSLYRQAGLINKQNKAFLVCMAGFSAFLSILYHIHNFDTDGYFSRIGLRQILVLLLLFACNASFFYSLCKLVLHKFNQILSQSKPKEKSFRFHFFVFFALSVPSYLAMFPAAIQWDNGTMLQMAYGLKTLTLDNPLLHTGLMYLVRLLAEISNATIALALYSLIQHSLLALLFAMLTHRLAKFHPKFALGLYIFYALTPAFGNYASALGKDLPFAMAILYLSLWIYDAIVIGEDFLSSFFSYTKLFLSGFFLSLLRNVGMYLFLFSLVPLCAFLIWKKKVAVGKILASALLSTALAIGLLQLSANALQAAPEKKGANKSIPLQQIARVIYLHGAGVLTDFEYESINAIMDIAQIPEKYLEGYSDHIKDLHKENISEEAISHFNKAHKSLGKRFAKEYFDSLYCNVYAYFVPGIHSDLKPSYFYEYQYINDIPAFQPMPHSNLQGIYRNLIALYRRLPLLDILLSTGMISYLHLLVLLYVLCSKNFRYLPVLAPSLLYLLGLLASPVNGYYRYSIPLLLTLGIAFTILLHCLQSTQKTQKMK